jgi:hypothetical protein
MKEFVVLRFRIVAPLLYGLVLLAMTSQAAENYSSWTYTSDITLNTTATGADIATTLNGFPVLVRLSSSNFIFSEARGRGQDIRFAKSDDTPLDYQIERWDSAKSVAEIWVKMDVAGNKADQILKMYWGSSFAADSSDANATFTSGYAQVWHLGETGTTIRANAVSGGLPATPFNYDGDESSSGMIGLADNFDGGAPGDYLDLGDGYTEFANGFSYSVWIYPTAVKKWNHILDLGNGEFSDNIIVNRADLTNDMFFTNYNGSVETLTKATNVWALNQWQYLTFTVSGTTAKVYKNGALLTTTTNNPSGISATNRTQNFLAKSNWAVDEYYQGKLDEPELSKVARSDDWIKLCYQNQKTSQNLLTLKAPIRCKAKFSGPVDTSGNEGSTITLIGSADCTTNFSWSIVSGPAPKILDPGVKAFSVILPRIVGDTVLVYRFSAVYPDSSPHKDIRVKVKETIPEPAFTFPTGLTWSGLDTLNFRPMVSNLAAIKASRDSALNWDWSLSGVAADTVWLKDGLKLVGAPDGKLLITLCLDNGGKPTCQTTTLTVSSATSRANLPQIKRPGARFLTWDAKGRHKAGLRLRQFRQAVE